MPNEHRIEVNGLVEPDRVHRRCYVDEDVFDLEMARIFHTTWIYVGHETQVPKPGDYWTTIIGRQRMILVRDKEEGVCVLFNRCPHRGTQICNERHGNVGDGFRCSYHAWQFNLDGSLRSIPMSEGAYENTRFSPDDPQFHMKPAPRVESYRGFVFASLTEKGPDLKTWLGGSIQAFDDMCDRAPDGEVEIVPNCFRIIQKSNWKIFLENQLDALHPSVAHESTGRAASEVQKDIEDRTGKAPPLSYHMLSAFTTPFDVWDSLQTVGQPYGHCMLQGYMGLRPTDPDTLEYEDRMRQSYGEKRAEEILSVNIHHVLVYPSLSVQSPLQQLRAVRPLAPDKTLTEIWHFRLKGAPEPIYRRALDYYYLVNSPSTMVNADDLVNFRKVQDGLQVDAGDWVSFHRNAGQDSVVDGIVTSATGMSEAPMRNMFKAWDEYMQAGV